MKASHPQAVLYSKQDYAGIGLRLLTMFIDLLVIGAFVYGLEVLFYTSDWAAVYAFWIMLSFLYLYLIEMKRRIGSLGNLLTRTKLVGIDGNRPSILFMVVRSAFWMMGLIFLIGDIIWITGDSRRQMIRDKFTGIYVVRRNSHPVGTGTIVYKNCMLLGFNFIFKEIDENKLQSLTVSQKI